MRDFVREGFSGEVLFPFLFGGTFIEGGDARKTTGLEMTDFPSFSEGLSLRGDKISIFTTASCAFPFLFGGTFIEGASSQSSALARLTFPFLFGGTFIEGYNKARLSKIRDGHFPSFSEGLSLRVLCGDNEHTCERVFPFLFGGTFIEGQGS